MTQREDPKGQAAIAAFKAHMDEKHPGWEARGGSVSGAQLQAFVEGWAVHGFWFSVAHWFKRVGVTDEAFTRCGKRGVVRLLFGQGSYKRCKHCQRSVDQRP